MFYLQPRDTQTEKILAKGHNNKVVSLGTINNTLKITFSSSKIYGLFSTHFDDELYYYAMSYQNEHDYERFRYIYPVLGIARVLEDVEISQRNRPLYQDIRYFLEQDFTTIPRDYSQIIRKFKEHFTARIDIKLMSAIGDFQILSCSDDKAIILKPEWFQKNGIGYLIQSCVGDLKIVVKSTVTGEISVVLRGRHVLDPKDNSKLIPYWIDYTKFIVNENPILNTLTPIWCSRPYYYDMKITAGEEIKIHVEWQPHRSDT